MLMEQINKLALHLGRFNLDLKDIIVSLLEKVITPYIESLCMFSHGRKRKRRAFCVCVLTYKAMFILVVEGSLCLFPVVFHSSNMDGIGQELLLSCLIKTLPSFSRLLIEFIKCWKRNQARLKRTGLEFAQGQCRE